MVIASNAKKPFRSWTELWYLDPQTRNLAPLGIGPAAAISFGPAGAMVVGRNTADPALWKRYRGGRVGALWIDRKGDGTWEPFQPLIQPTNLAAPMWIGDRIYFLSDHEGIANLYSVTPNATDLRRHTDHQTFPGAAAN